MKLRHSFLNGHGRPRTAFLLYRHRQYCSTRNILHRRIQLLLWSSSHQAQRPQWGDYYWIDMVKLCQGFLGEGQEVEKVIYFTASPLNPEKSSRQSAFLNANKLINGDRFEVVRGKYLDKQIQCPNCHYARCGDGWHQALRSTREMDTRKHRKVICFLLFVSK